MRVSVSISGGRTSGYMAWWLKNNPDIVAEKLGVKEVSYVFLFANTGMEHPDTLRFLNDLDREFGLGIIWLEAVPLHNIRLGSGHRIVSYESAATIDQWREKGHPFQEYVRKYGIPNVKFIGCTRELKLNAMRSYQRSRGMNHPRDFYTAIGIREDERRRVAKSADAQNIIYPLVDWEPMGKEDILEWWSQYEWDLGIPEWLGNCVFCYKKSYKKLALTWRDFPAAFDFTAEMESQYGQRGDGRTHFFRMNTSTERLIASFTDPDAAEGYVRMHDAGCSESCEPYPTIEV